jgi:hypothetical protein
MERRTRVLKMGSDSAHQSNNQRIAHHEGSPTVRHSLRPIIIEAI